MMIFVYLNIAAAMFASAIWGIWAAKWYRRRAWGLVFAHCLASLIALTVGVAFLVSIGGPLLGPFHVSRYLLAVASMVMLAPALAHYLELRRDEYREAFSTGVKERLTNGNGSQGGGGNET